jgi:hypothetical protein
MKINEYNIVTTFPKSNSKIVERGKMEHYVIKFVSDLRQAGGFVRVLRFPSPIKLTAKYVINASKIVIYISF